MDISFENMILRRKEFLALRKIKRKPNLLFYYTDVERLIRYELVKRNIIFETNGEDGGLVQFHITEKGLSYLDWKTKQERTIPIKVVKWLLGVFAAAVVAKLIDWLASIAR